jgi:hypothetical protein
MFFIDQPRTSRFNPRDGVNGRGETGSQERKEAREKGSE